MQLHLLVAGQVDKESSPCSHLNKEKLPDRKENEALEQAASGTGGVYIKSLRTG